MTKSDLNYFARIKEETGRSIERASIRCGMCDGTGESMWEPACTACDGYGETLEFVYSDCRCLVERSDDNDTDCLTCFPEPAELEAAA